jgi:hypothetical protein
MSVTTVTGALLARQLELGSERQALRVGAIPPVPTGGALAVT